MRTCKNFLFNFAELDVLKSFFSYVSFFLLSKHSSYIDGNAQNFSGSLSFDYFLSSPPSSEFPLPFPRSTRLAPTFRSFWNNFEGRSGRD